MGDTPLSLRDTPLSLRDTLLSLNLYFLIVYIHVYIYIQRKLNILKFLYSPLCQNSNSYWYIIMSCIFLKVIFYKNSIKNIPHQTQKNNILFIPGTVEFPCPTRPTRTCRTSRISWLVCPGTSKNNKA